MSDGDGRFADDASAADHRGADWAVCLEINANTTAVYGNVKAEQIQPAQAGLHKGPRTEGRTGADRVRATLAGSIDASVAAPSNSWTQTSSER